MSEGRGLEKGRGSGTGEGWEEGEWCKTHTQNE